MHALPDATENSRWSTPPSNGRRIALATIVGTTVEWYDYFIYASMAALVFPQLFFEPAGPAASVIISFASVGVSFLFRPIGAIVAGHYGDKIGRKAMLVLTLILMGGATTIIGILPTTETIGMAAVVLLVLLRIIQGISAGGEWGGAALMAVESAPSSHRGRWGTYPQIGVPLGMLLASGVLSLMTGVISPGEAFVDWGWRVPFLLSAILIVMGYLVRRAVSESPVFTQIAENKEQTNMPVVVLFRRFGVLVLLCALVFSGNNAAGYMVTGGFIQGYATDPSGPVGLERTPVLLAVMAGAFTWLVSTLAAGILADRIGRKRCYIIGWIWQLAMVFPLFWLINTGSIALLTIAICLLSLGLGFTYGPQSAWYAELFPATVRYSGISISTAFGTIVGGAFAPTISAALVASTGTTVSVSAYLGVLTVIGLGATLLLRDRPGIGLELDNAEVQSEGAIARLGQSRGARPVRRGD
ncbi:MFS transporter [Brevibacterium sp. UCMA 11754]|uniref:MFS transporter n=1 Tax=Brevibacterium sp. UCMA 11754 TaxID=2749198 RepID=UPI001F40C3AD|nr:MFS transporter [Brevibacterium sp. UCMA 11754]MCF2574478.1 MHS family MFS transporter [Brevibacterium sp. UCMA 11754]